MRFALEELDVEIGKLRGLLRMLHEDQPDTLDEVFQFHLGNLLGQAAGEHHGYIRQCAAEMRAGLEGAVAATDG